ncbi:MAG: GntR family transcriptional regulator [Bacteroidota bacterium]|nr:MAG: GntR family transcriptional regulator [Bacteroidota bacterium]
MAQLGRYNTLTVAKEVDFGLYLEDSEYGEILIPKRYVPENCKVDDQLEIFLYLDSEDRPVATTEKPLVQVGEFAFLDVVSLTPVGAFLNWGLPKDLLLPFREQKAPPEEGQKLLVYVYYDAESKRIVASEKIDKFLDNVPAEYTPNEEVDILIVRKTNLGFNAIINHQHWGLLYQNEVHQPIAPGQTLKAYIKAIRPDEKIDLSLYKAGYARVGDSTLHILAYLKENNGFMPFNDKSEAEEINWVFGISKKNFKKALGALYKNRQIDITPEGVKLT